MLSALTHDFVVAVWLDTRAKIHEERPARYGKTKQRDTEIVTDSTDHPGVTKQPQDEDAMDSAPLKTSSVPCEGTAGLSSCSTCCPS